MAFGKFHGLKAVLESNQQCSHRGMSPGEQGGPRPTFQKAVARAGWGVSPRPLLAAFHWMNIKCLLKRRTKALFLWKGVWDKHLCEGGGSVLSLRKNRHQSAPLPILHPLWSLQCTGHTRCVCGSVLHSWPCTQLLPTLGSHHRFLSLTCDL